MSLFGLLRSAARLPESLHIAGRTLPLIVERRAASRGIRLRADAVQGVVRLSLPARGGTADAAVLLGHHRDWLARQVAGWPEPLPFAPGARIPFDGGHLTIDHAADYPRTPRRDGDRLVIGGPLDLLAARTRRWLQAAALADLTPATHDIAGRIDRTVTQVRVGDPRGRWGSCITPNDGSGGRIAYSWRLILAPPHVRANVVAHEVAHLIHANHGPGFHALLARLDPGTAAARTWLKRHGAGLHWVGRAA